MRWTLLGLGTWDIPVYSNAFSSISEAMWQELPKIIIIVAIVEAKKKKNRRRVQRENEIPHEISMLNRLQIIFNVYDFCCDQLQVLLLHYYYYIQVNQQLLTLNRNKPNDHTEASSDFARSSTDIIIYLFFIFIFI